MKRRYLILLLFLGMFASTFCLGQVKEDTLKNHKTIAQGVFAKGPIYPNFYSVGYTYERRKRKNNFGFFSGIAVNSFWSPTLYRRYTNFYLGITPFYKFGKWYGIYVGLQCGWSINPIVYSDKIGKTAPADRPYAMAFFNGLQFGPFLRTKNRRWEFLIAFGVGIKIEQSIIAKDIFKWDKNSANYDDYTFRWRRGYFQPTFSLTVTYYFKIKEK